MIASRVSSASRTSVRAPQRVALPSLGRAKVVTRAIEDTNIAINLLSSTTVRRQVLQFSSAFAHSPSTLPLSTPQLLFGKVCVT